MTGSVSIQLPLDCWRFIEEARAWPTREPLPPDVRATLTGPHPIALAGAVPAPRVVVAMTRDQAGTFQRWLHALHDSLKHDDARRLTCLMCISRVAVAIMLSERS